MLSIECVLHGSLEDSLPAGRKSNLVTLQFATEPSVIELLTQFNLDQEYLQFALADGQYIEIEHWNEPISAKRVQLWPRISGG